MIEYEILSQKERAFWSIANQLARLATAAERYVDIMTPPALPTDFRVDIQEDIQHVSYDDAQLGREK